MERERETERQKPVPPQLEKLLVNKPTPSRVTQTPVATGGKILCRILKGEGGSKWVSGNARSAIALSKFVR